MRRGGGVVDDRTVDIPGAFEMLLEEIEAQISLVSKAIAFSAQKGEFDDAKKAISQAEKLTGFRSRVADLREEWDHDLYDKPAKHIEQKGKPASPKYFGKLKKGVRTNEAAFCVPILKALLEFDGSAKMKRVLDRVAELMKTELKPVDYQSLPSDPDLIRWRNTAQWARNTLVKRGLLKGDSPHGTWEITAEGRKYLKDQTWP